MFQDAVNGALRRVPGGVRPRQVPSAGSSQTTSTSLSKPSTTLRQPVTSYSQPVATALPHSEFSIVTNGVNIGNSDDLCTALLPAHGLIEFNDTFTLYLEEPVSFVALCANQTIFKGDPGNSNTTVLQQSEIPFYASIYPNLYALATATVVSYILVILIFITPRTFYVGGPGTGAGISGVGGFRTFFTGTSGRGSGAIGIGRRPLLQKCAALTVAVSLTIATADSFRYAEKQYTQGFINSKTLVEDVVGSTEIKVTRVISDTFLWLAQVQTLIRLFPRHKEKVTIKWLGFGLVLCDTVFSILENFLSGVNATRPQSFTDAIPALSYLFELSIGMIYASCVIYYALSKRRFAFWHAKMRNICLVALLSVIAVLIPVVFFITDLAEPEIATWGEYIRWVGAAAASVVVWEWVERIEALERDEKKDGILGREIFDGDEMLEITPSEDGFNDDQPRRPTNDGQTKSAKFWKNVRDLNIDIQPKIPLRKWKKGKMKENDEKDVKTVEIATSKSTDAQITRPLQAVTPISRSDTNSAASTVYAVRYHDPFSPSPAIPEERATDDRRESVAVNALPAISDESTLTNSTSTTMEKQRRSSQADSVQVVSSGRQLWQNVSNPFKRKRTEPPAEVAAQIIESQSRRSPADGNLNLKNRITTFTAAQRARFGGRPPRKRTPLGITVIPAQPRVSRVNNDGEIDPDAMINATMEEQADSTPNSEINSPDLASLPVTVIPAPKRGGRTWSPDDLAHHGQRTPPPDSIPDTSHDIQNQNHPPIQPSGPRDDSQNSNSIASASPTPDVTLSSSNPHALSPPQALNSQRGTLTISESPGRARDPNGPSSTSPVNLRRSRNNRSATITSISDRLGSASPGNGSGTSIPRPTSTTADERSNRSAGVDSSGS